MCLMDIARMKRPWHSPMADIITALRLLYHIGTRIEKAFMAEWRGQRGKYASWAPFAIKNAVFGAGYGKNAAS